MLIRSQNKEVLVNMDNVKELFLAVYDTHTDVMATTDGASNIGRYSTKEKALKVLDSLQSRYAEYVQIGSVANGTIGLFDVPKVYSMPQDDEVEA